MIPLSSVIKSLSSRYQALSSDLITLDNADNDLLDFPKAHLSGASWLTLGFLRAPETDSDWLTHRPPEAAEVLSISNLQTAPMCDTVVTFEVLSTHAPKCESVVTFYSKVHHSRRIPPRISENIRERRPLALSTYTCGRRKRPYAILSSLFSFANLQTAPTCDAVVT